MIRKVLLILFLFTILTNSSIAAVPKKSDVSSEPKIELVDLKPFVVAFYENGKVKYTLDYTIRLQIDTKIQETLQYDYAKIRDNILILIRKYLNNKTDYRDVKYHELKSQISNYFNKNYPSGDIKKVLISTAFIR